MATYFSVEPKSNGYQVNFIELTGQRLLWENPFTTVPLAIKSFENAQPGAKYVSWDIFMKRLEKIEKDRERVVAWNHLVHDTTNDH